MSFLWSKGRYLRTCDTGLDCQTVLVEGRVPESCGDDGRKGSQAEATDLCRKPSPKNLCDGCNKHFKHLEDRAISVFEVLSRGHTATIAGGHRAILAAWGAKTAYTLIAADIGLEDAVPERHRYELRRNGEPVESVWIGYAALSGPVNKIVSETTVSSSHGQVAGYNATFTFANIALVVFGMERLLPGDAFDTIAGIEQVWPRENVGSVGWPPPYAFTMTSLKSLAEYVPASSPRAAI